MKNSKEFLLDDGERICVEYDSAGRESTKKTFNQAGDLVEKIEFRYSTDNLLVEWKWYNANGGLVGSFLGHMNGCDIINTQKNMNVDWLIPPLDE